MRRTQRVELLQTRAGGCAWATCLLAAVLAGGCGSDVEPAAGSEDESQPILPAETPTPESLIDVPRVLERLDGCFGRARALALYRPGAFPADTPGTMATAWADSSCTTVASTQDPTPAFTDPQLPCVGESSTWEWDCGGSELVRAFATGDCQVGDDWDGDGWGRMTDTVTGDGVSIGVEAERDFFGHYAQGHDIHTMAWSVSWDGPTEGGPSWLDGGIESIDLRGDLLWEDRWGDDDGYGPTISLDAAGRASWAGLCDATWDLSWYRSEMENANDPGCDEEPASGWLSLSDSIDVTLRFGDGTCDGCVDVEIGGVIETRTCLFRLDLGD